MEPGTTKCTKTGIIPRTLLKIYEQIKNIPRQGVHGIPVVRTWLFHCAMHMGLIPGWGTKIPRRGQKISGINSYLLLGDQGIITSNVYFKKL